MDRCQEKRDFTGNTRSAFVTIGSRNFAREEREERYYYATPPYVVKLLLEKECFAKRVWECAAGGEHLAHALREEGHEVWCTDVVNRTGFVDVLDFLTSDVAWDGDIITNPPYKHAEAFVRRAMERVQHGAKVAMLLKLTFLEGRERRALFRDYPPKSVYVSSRRIMCAKNGDFASMTGRSSAMAYAWFVWEQGYKGETVVGWFNE